MSFAELYDKSGKAIAIAIFDTVNLREVSKYKWCLNTHGYVQATLPNYGKSIRMHQLLFQAADTIDHINRNPLDNRMDNLRNADYSTQNQNRDMRARSGAKGVFKSGKRFYPRLWNGTSNVSLGWYDTLEEASSVYQSTYEQLYS